MVFRQGNRSVLLASLLVAGLAPRADAGVREVWESFKTTIDEWMEDSSKKDELTPLEQTVIVHPARPFPSKPFAREMPRVQSRYEFAVNRSVRGFKYTITIPRFEPEKQQINLPYRTTNPFDFHFREALVALSPLHEAEMTAQHLLTSGKREEVFWNPAEQRVIDVLNVTVGVSAAKLAEVGLGTQWPIMSNIKTMEKWHKLNPLVSPALSPLVKVFHTRDPGEAYIQNRQRIQHQLSALENELGGGHAWYVDNHVPGTGFQFTLESRAPIRKAAVWINDMNEHRGEIHIEELVSDPPIETHLITPRGTVIRNGSFEGKAEFSSRFNVSNPEYSVNLSNDGSGNKYTVSIHNSHTDMQDVIVLFDAPGVGNLGSISNDRNNLRRIKPGNGDNRGNLMTQFVHAFFSGSASSPSSGKIFVPHSIRSRIQNTNDVGEIIAKQFQVIRRDMSRVGFTVSRHLEIAGHDGINAYLNANDREIRGLGILINGPNGDHFDSTLYLHGFCNPPQQLSPSFTTRKIGQHTGRPKFSPGVFQGPNNRYSTTADRAGNGFRYKISIPTSREAEEDIIMFFDHDDGNNFELDFNYTGKEPISNLGELSRSNRAREKITHFLWGQTKDIPLDELILHPNILTRIQDRGKTKLGLLQQLRTVDDAMVSPTKLIMNHLEHSNYKGVTATITCPTTPMETIGLWIIGPDGNKLHSSLFLHGFCDGIPVQDAEEVHIYAGSFFDVIENFEHSWHNRNTKNLFCLASREDRPFVVSYIRQFNDSARHGQLRYDLESRGLDRFDLTIYGLGVHIGPMSFKFTYNQWYLERGNRYESGAAEITDLRQSRSQKLDQPATSLREAIQGIVDNNPGRAFSNRHVDVYDGRLSTTYQELVQEIENNHRNVHHYAFGKFTKISSHRCRFQYTATTKDFVQYHEVDLTKVQARWFITRDELLRRERLQPGYDAQQQYLQQLEEIERGQRIWDFVSPFIKD